MSPTENDKRITSKLGDYSLMKQFIDRETPHSSRLIGISSSGRQPLSSSSSSSSSQPYQNASAVNRNMSSAGAHPFNHVAPMPPSSAQRGSSIFVKPADNKIPYNGRGSYSSQPPIPNKPDVSVQCNEYVK